MSTTARILHFFFNSRIVAVTVLILLLLPLILFSIDVYIFLNGGEAGGAALVPGHVTLLGILAGIFGYLPITVFAAMLLLVVGCFSFGIVIQMGGCFVFPFFSGILLASAAYVIAVIVDKGFLLLTQESARKLLWISYAIAVSAYVIILIGYMTVTFIQGGA